jgi:hypothetical protein
MKGMTIKLSDDTLRRLRRESKKSGRTVGALVRDRVDAAGDDRSGSVYALTADLAGSVDGPHRSMTNARRRFRKSR